MPGVDQPANGVVGDLLRVPGGQVFGATLTYRRTRQWGATRVIASWQLVISGVLATVGLVILSLVGFLLVGTVSNPYLLAASALGLAGIVLIVQWAARNPDRIETVLLGVLGWINARRHLPVDHGADRVRAVVEQAEAVEMTGSQLARAFAWSLLNWVADIGCLWAAAEVVGVQHSPGGLCIAYVTGKIVGTAPITPGGLGTVEFALITALTAGGRTAAEAFAAVFVYRVVSFVLVALAGWVVFFLAYRNTVEIDPDEVDQDGAEDGGETGRIPGTPDGAVPDGQDSPVSAGGTAPTRPVRALSRWPIDGTYWSPTGPHHGERRRSEHSHGSTRIRGDEQGR